MATDQGVLSANFGNPPETAFRIFERTLIEGRIVAKGDDEDAATGIRASGFVVARWPSYLAGLFIVTSGIRCAQMDGRDVK